MHIILSFDRYLTSCEIFLENIVKSYLGAKELLRKGDFVVARSLIPSVLNAVDKTIKETLTKFTKSLGAEIFLFSGIITGKA